MNFAPLTDLIAILENEIALGEELTVNLDAQKQAILHWNSGELLVHLDARERGLRSLAELEVRRLAALKALKFPPDESVTLRRVIAGLSENDPERVTISGLRQRMRDVFTRLTAEEGSLHKLMEALLGHVQDALLAIPETAGTLYNESGISCATDDRLGLYQSKA